MEDIIEEIKVFNEERDWDKFHTPENLAKTISIEAGELLECFQWTSDFERSEVLDELADVMVNCLQMSIALNVDIKEVIRAKMKKNIEKYPADKARGNCLKYDKLK